MIVYLLYLLAGLLAIAGFGVCVGLVVTSSPVTTVTVIAILVLMWVVTEAYTLWDEDERIKRNRAA